MLPSPATFSKPVPLPPLYVLHSSSYYLPLQVMSLVLTPSLGGSASHLYYLSMPTCLTAPACAQPARPFHAKHPGPGVKEGQSWPSQSPKSWTLGCFNAHVCSRGWQALTCAVFVPGVAADGFHQEAVVGHGFSASVLKGEKNPSQPCLCPRPGSS